MSSLLTVVLQPLQMRQIYFLFILFFCFSCKENLSKHESVSAYSKFWQNNFSDSVFRALYDIADLKNYSDNSKYIARVTYNIPFGNVTIIELDEITNGINLCVKQPVVKLSPAEYFSPQRSLPFNQCCYFYADSSARTVKSLFQKYNLHRETFSFKCKACFDPIDWKMEIFDHGQYSLMAKDNLTQQDSIVTVSLLHLVHFSEKNGYRINIP